MIGILLDDGVTEVFLPRVDHVTTAEEAARHLFAGLLKVTRIHGGEARLLLPDNSDVGVGRFGVRWGGGPTQWSEAYTVSEGAEAREFVAVADDDFTVTFAEIDG